MAAIDSVNINFLDLLVVGGMLFGAYSGFKEGLSGAVQKAALVVAALLAIRYYALFDGYILQLFDVSPQLSPYISGIIIFALLGLVMFSVLSGFTGTVAKVTNSKLPFNIDKILGTIWGWIKWTMIISFGTLFLGRVGLPPASLTSNSRLYEWTRGIGMTTVQSIFAEVPLVMKFVHFFENEIKPSNYTTDPNNPNPTPAPTTYTPPPPQDRTIVQPTTTNRGTDLPPRREPEPQIPAVPRKPPTVR